MSAPSPAVRNLGRRLLTHELERGMDRQADAVAWWAAAERVFRKLGEPLGRVVGTEGNRALLKRALHLARNTHSLLKGVQAAASPLAGLGAGTASAPSDLGGLDGLKAVVQRADAAAARDALSSVLAHLLWLLVTFIGDSLTRRAVREAWPEITLDDLDELEEPQLGVEPVPVSEEAST